MEMDTIAAFLELVRAGSVLGAAKRLGVSRATIRRRLDTLEEQLGRPVLERRGDELVLTPAGRLLQREGPELLGATRRLERTIRELGADEGSGTLIVALPNGVPGPLYAPFARVLSERWPRLQVTTRFSPDPLRELEGDADVAIVVDERPGEPWVSRLLGDFEERAFAHLSYVERAGLPATLDELEDHRLLSWATPGREPTSWPLRRGGAHTISPALATNDLRSLHDCIEAGLGIGLIPVRQEDPRLRLVLPTLLGRRRKFWLASASASRWSPNVRAFGRELASFLALEVFRLIR
jgi:DNA-binding transcriptional LysR family regulator